MDILSSVVTVYYLERCQMWGQKKFVLFEKIQSCRSQTIIEMTLLFDIFSTESSMNTSVSIRNYHLLINYCDLFNETFKSFDIHKLWFIVLTQLLNSIFQLYQTLSLLVNFFISFLHGTYKETMISACIRYPRDNRNNYMDRSL